MAQGIVRVGDLPQVIPVFPLDGAVLLARGQLPLNIFEPRYLNMIDDAMAGDRMVGMVREADTQVDYVENNRRYFAPSITWAPNEDTKLTVLGSYQRNEGDFYAQVPAWPFDTTYLV